MSDQSQINQILTIAQPRLKICYAQQKEVLYELIRGIASAKKIYLCGKGQILGKLTCFYSQAT